MAHVVFVHGVNVRKEKNPPAYNAVVAARQAAFSKHCFSGTTVRYYDPYWGQFGAKADAEFGTIPSGSGGVELGVLGGGQGGPLQNPLLEAARQDFFSTIDAICYELDRSDNAEEQMLAENIALYSASVEPRGVSAEPVHPDWLFTVTTDEAFLDRLFIEARSITDQTPVTLGVLGDVKGKVLNAGIGLIDGKLERIVRKMTPSIATFLGDVGVYLKNGDARGRIKSEVMADIEKAATEAKVDGRPLILIGHSMGANILYDILSNPQDVGEMAEKVGFAISIDLFLTVGTQLGLLEEFDLFSTSRTGARPRKPSFIDRWWHVYNQMDVLSFRAAPVIDGVEEFRVDTRANIIDAHTAYFTSKLFQTRLSKRLKDSGVVP